MLACSSILSLGWYLSTSTALSGPLGEFVPVIGSIAIAGIVPVLVHRQIVQNRFNSAQLSTSQRIEAFNRHTAVNVVDSNHNITEVNDRLLELTGYDRSQLIGKPVCLFYGEDSVKTAQEIREALRRGEIWQGETTLQHAGGQTVTTQTTVVPLFDAQKNWLGSITVRTDVTAAHELAAQRETAQTLHELRDDIWIVDADTERFSYMNRAASRRLEMEKGEYLLTNMSDLEPMRGIRRVVHACRRLRETGESTTNFEIELNDVPFYVTVKYLPNRSQRSRYLILLTDISDRVEQAQKKADFISTVSHELRSPLTSIKGSMGLLLANSAGDLPQKALGLLEIAHRNADRLVLIINDILDLEKISKGHMEFEAVNVDMNAILREAFDANVALQSRFTINFKLSGDQDPLYVQTDPNRVIQVLNNFISNACKFSRPSATVEINLRDEGDSVRVSVRDEGPGIADTDKQKVFERFADLSNSDRAAKGGTGLGLSICKAIIQGLGGTIGFETAEGVGSTFYFVLPKNVAPSIEHSNMVLLRAAG